MRLRQTLLHIAALATAGCGGSVAATAPATAEGGVDSGAGVEAGGQDALVDSAYDSGGHDSATDGPGGDSAIDSGNPEVSCGGCGCNGPLVPSGNATADQACAMAYQSTTPFVYGPACKDFCAALNNNGAASYFCSLPKAYVNAYLAAQSDGGDADGGADAAVDGGAQCPSWSGPVIVTCGYNCTGRRTAGVEDCASGGTTIGEILARRAYLEAVSVHAFATLERELAAHGAPPALRREARRARRDEIRHTAMMLRLARRFGAVPPAMPAAPPPAHPGRALFAIALENAVEGCVRETYGAVVGLIEARESSDSHVRRAMQSIAADECRHAELAWAVAEWILPRLTPQQRDAIECAVREAVERLAREGDRTIVEQLSARVWRRPGRSGAMLAA